MKISRPNLKMNILHHEDPRLKHDQVNIEVRKNASRGCKICKVNKYNIMMIIRMTVWSSSKLKSSFIFYKTDWKMFILDFGWYFYLNMISRRSDTMCSWSDKNIKKFSYNIYIRWKDEADQIKTWKYQD